MKVRTAVITAAARSQRALPLQTLIDRDGEEKPVLAILVEQVLQAGIEEICVIVAPEMETAYGQAVGKHLGHVRFVAQNEPRGYGHAIWCARDLPAGDAFLHLVGRPPVRSTATARPRPAAARGRAGRGVLGLCRADHPRKAAAALRRRWRTARRRTAGALPGRDRPRKADAHRGRAEAHRPGLRAGYYLCFFGMHVLTPRSWIFSAAGLPRPPDGVVAVRGAGRAGPPGAIPRAGGAAPPLRHRRALRPAHRAARARPERTRPRRSPRAAGGAAGGAADAGRPRAGAGNEPADRPITSHESRGSATARSIAVRAARRWRELLADAPRSTVSGAPSDNLYERVRALFFLYAIHRFHLPRASPARPRGR